MELSMKAISAPGADKEILLFWIGLISQLIHCVEMISQGRPFQLVLLVSFANNILRGSTNCRMRDIKCASLLS
jgi:hypothetical protein